MTASTTNESERPLWQYSAGELATLIAEGAVSAVEVTRAHIARCEELHPQLNALVVNRFAAALQEAEAADAQRRRGDALGPLHGVPITVKECFFVAGLPATIGLTARTGELSTETGLLVRRLQDAGAIVLGKTNLSQLMMWHESDNPVYGRTNNPWDAQRTCGGSTGGEAALIARGGSPLGLGNDLGGSIRVPCHFCGIQGLKPTIRRLPRGGAVANFRGLTALSSVVGPMARRVDDLELALRILVGDLHDDQTHVPPVPLRASRDVAIRSLRVGYWEDDGFFPPSAAVRRAVRESVAALTDRGVHIEPFTPPHAASLVECYLKLIAADGAADARRLSRGSRIDWRLGRMLWLEGLPRMVRALAVCGLKVAGQHTMAKLVRLTGPLSADKEWQAAHAAAEASASFLQLLRDRRLDALLCPPHALPAMPHRLAIDLVAAASYAFLPNILGFPAGVVRAGTVRPEEEAGRPQSRDLAHRRARDTDRGSAGLPVGVQVIARPWREDVTLAVMRTLEEHFGPPMA